MLIALGIAVFLSLAIGIAAARSRPVERVVIPIVDVLQTLPILAFFPVMIYLVVAFLPGLIGINAAVIFLIITSMLWNMIFGVYEAVKSIPTEFIEMSRLSGMSLYQRIKKIFVPASLPRLSEQMNLSWAIGLFYLVTSEIFSAGNKTYTVQGIGVALAQLGFSGNLPYYALGIAIFIGFVVATKLTLFSWFERFSTRFNSEAVEKKKKHGEEDFGYMLSKSKLLHAAKGAYISSKDRLESFISKNKKALTALSLAAICAVLLVLVLYYVVPNVGLGQLTPLPGYEWTALIALLYSFVRIWGAFLAVLAVAIPVSIYVVFLSKYKKTYMLLFQIIASVPATLLLPLIVSALANNAEAVAFVIYFLSGVWYIIFSISGSTKALPINVDEVKKVFRVKGRAAWKNIYLTAILPGLITGGITAIAAEWNASIVAEYFLSTSGTVETSVHTGVGVLLNTSLSSGNLSLMLLVLVNMTAMILLLDTFVWKRLYSRITSVYT